MGTVKRVGSEWWIAPDLQAALDAGKTFEEWLDGRIPVESHARESADNAKDEHGVEDQHKRNKRHAKKNNLAIVKFGTDNDITAAKANEARDAFELLLIELRSRHTVEGYPVRGVMVRERERLYRTATDAERAYDALTSERDGILYESGNNGRFVDLYSDGIEYDWYSQLAGAKREIRKDRERAIDAHEARALRGKSEGGPRRFGWKAGNKKKGRRANNKKKPDEWPILKQMIEDATAGKAWNTIAEQLNADGVLTTLGNKWRGTGVRDLVSNPAMCGYRIRHEDLVRDEKGNPVVGKWHHPATPAQWEAIVKRIHQQRAQKGLSVENVDHSPGSPSTRTRKYLFSTFLRCGRTVAHRGICNNKLNGKPYSYGAPGDFLYGCTPRGRGECGGLGRNGPKVDEYLTELVLQRHDEMLNDRPIPVEKWDKEAELAQWENKCARLTKEWLTTPYGDSKYYRNLPIIEAKLKELRQERAKFNKRQAEKVAAYSESSVRARWKTMDLAQKRAAIGQVLVAVIVYPIPKGVSKSAPFNPDLLKPIWRTPATATGEASQDMYNAA